MRRHRSGVDGVGRVKEGLLAGGRTRIYTGASAWRSRGVQGLVIWPEKSPRRTVFQLGLKTGVGARCGRTARRVSWFGPQNQGWRPVRPGGQEGLVVWASKLPRRPVSRFGPQNRGWRSMRSGGQEGLVVWPQNHHRRGFPGFDSKPGAAPGLTR